MMRQTFLSFLLLSTINLSLSNELPTGSRTFEVMVPMRDNVKLHTRVVLPRGALDGNSKYTTIIDRSPYGYTGLEWIADIFMPFGFVAVGQDMRGTELSEGNFTIWHSDADDSFDLGEWIVKQDWSNGKIFSFGASADGLAAFTTNYYSPDWLQAQYYVWSSSLGYEVIYPNGAYLEALADTWIRSTVPEFADDCLQVVKENEAFNEWWNAVEMTPNEYGHVRGPSGFWAGWYDIFLVGNLAAYEGYNTKSDPAFLHSSRITVDPLGHCQKAAEFFGPNLIEGRTLVALSQAFETYGIHAVTRTNIKNVTFYVMSSNDEAGAAAGLYWTSMEQFPQSRSVKYYLHADGSASTTAPKAAEGAESSSYVHDPANPVPTRGGNNLDLPCGPLDQSDVDARADVLVFTTAPFADELPLTGPLFADLFVSSDAIDTDFMVKIEDLYPTGEARLIQDSAVRMRWREGGSQPLSMEKGKVYPAHLSLWNTSYVLAPGHSLRVAIASSNTPRFSVNLNNGQLLGDKQVREAVVATNAIYHSAQYPSSVSLPVVLKHQLPKVHLIEEVQKGYPFIDAQKILKDHPDLFEKLARPSRRT